MKDGFIKVSAISPRVTVADTKKNGERVGFESLALSESKIIVTPELYVCGATVGDLAKNETLLCGAKKALCEIAEKTKSLDALIFVGAPLRSAGKIYDCAVAINRGEILGATAKKYVSGVFSPAPVSPAECEIDGKTITISAHPLYTYKSVENLVVGVEIGDDLFGVYSPACDCVSMGATVIVNLSARAEYADSYGDLLNMVKAQSQKLQCAYILSNAGYGESTTDLAFEECGIICQNGQVLCDRESSISSPFSAVIDVNAIAYQRKGNAQFSQKEREIEHFFSLTEQETVLFANQFNQFPFLPRQNQELEHILFLQARALATRIESARSKKIVLGLSGGLDSTLALIVAVRAVEFLGEKLFNLKDIIAVTMPCFGTTKRTKSNAQKLAEAYHVTLKEVDITASVRQHLSDIGHDGVTADVTYENAQARERTQVIMDIANISGGIVVGTGDLSEVALGWSTYNGDHMSMYGVNSSVPKTLVRALVSYEKDKMAGDVPRRYDVETIACVLADILDTPVSPELTPAKEGEIAQITEDIVGPYELHDFFLYNFIVNGYTPKKVLRTATVAFEKKYTADTVKKWLKNFIRRFFTQQFKRSCMPDGAKVTAVSLSPRGAWKMPSDASATLWLDEIE